MSKLVKVCQKLSSRRIPLSKIDYGDDFDFEFILDYCSSHNFKLVYIDGMYKGGELPSSYLIYEYQADRTTLYICVEKDSHESYGRLFFVFDIKNYDDVMYRIRMILRDYNIWLEENKLKKEV